MNTYVLIFDISQIAPAIMRGRLDKSSYVRDWIWMTDGVALIKSPMSATDLSSELRSDYPTLKFFVSATLPQLSDGWLPGQVWDFINRDQRIGAIPDFPKPTGLASLLAPSISTR